MLAGRGFLACGFFRYASWTAIVSRNTRASDVVDWWDDAFVQSRPAYVV